MWLVSVMVLVTTSVAIISGFRSLVALAHFAKDSDFHIVYLVEFVFGLIIFGSASLLTYLLVRIDLILVKSRTVWGPSLQDLYAWIQRIFIVLLAGSALMIVYGIGRVLTSRTTMDRDSGLVAFGTGWLLAVFVAASAIWLRVLTRGSFRWDVLWGLFKRARS